MGVLCADKLPDMDVADKMSIAFDPREEKEGHAGKDWIPTFVPPKKMIVHPLQDPKGKRWASYFYKIKQKEKKNGRIFKFCREGLNSMKLINLSCRSKKIFKRVLKGKFARRY